MNKEATVFTLDQLIQREGLLCSQEATDIESVFDSLMPKDAEGKIAQPLIVGVDGAVTAGKSFTASRLTSYHRGQGYNCILIHGDWYMASREDRQLEAAKARSASYSILEYDHMNCDFDEIANTIGTIRRFFQTGEEALRTRVSHAYNRESGERNGHIDLQMESGSIVVVEGTGILNERISPLLDVRIRVDIGSYQETIRRLCQRELEKTQPNRLAKAFVQERYDLIDHRYDEYLRSRDSEYFDVLLDTTNPGLIKVYAR